MALSKLDVAVAAAVVACLLRVEHGHRVMIGVTATDAAPRTSSICPATDYAPFSTACLKYMYDGVLPPLRPRLTVAASASVVSTDTDSPSDLRAVACPAGKENSGRYCRRLGPNNGIQYP